MGWYVVIKTIRGVPYRYRQRAWREGGKVRTECRCLGRVDGAGRGSGNTTAPVQPPADTWRAELRDGLAEVRRRLAEQGEHFLIETLNRHDFTTMAHAAVLDVLRAIASGWSQDGGDNYSGEYLSIVIARLAAFRNTTRARRETWRTHLSDRLAIAETWMPEQRLKDGVREILERMEVSDPERVVGLLERLLSHIDRSSDVLHEQAARHIESALRDLRNTTGVHTDASLMEALLTGSRSARRRKRPYRKSGARRTTPQAVDARVIKIPVRLGIAIRTQCFGEDKDLESIGLGLNDEDGGWYSKTRDMIQIPDAGRFVNRQGHPSATEHYEHALLYETCHAVWHPSRLNKAWHHRPLWGADGYAASEVVTDMAACLIERRLGNKRVALWAQQTDYVQGWLARAGLNDAEITRLKQQAVIVADYMMAQLGSGGMCVECGADVPARNTTCRRCERF